MKICMSKEKSALAIFSDFPSEFADEHIRAVARKGGGNFKLVMIQSSHRFGLAASFGWVGSGPAASLRSASGRSGPLRAPSEPTQPNWIQTNLATKRRDQTGGLIES